MSKYFFHIMNGEAVIDKVGTDYATMDEMRTQAIRAAGEMLSVGEQSWTGDAWRMVVTDASDHIVLGLSFSIDRHGL